jgi:hypothetical protein
MRLLQRRNIAGQILRWKTHIKGFFFGGFSIPCSINYMEVKELLIITY